MTIEDGTYLPTLTPTISTNRHGYYVSLPDYECRVLRFSETLVDEIFEAYRLVALQLTCADPLAPTHYIGVWTQGDHVYFDMSQLVRDRDEAIALGKERKQLCIWDIANNRPIAIRDSQHIDANKE